MTNTSATARNNLDALINMATTGDLIRALIAIESVSFLEMHERVAKAEIVDAVATRYPAFAAAIATDDLDDERTSTEILFDLLAA